MPHVASPLISRPLVSFQSHVGYGFVGNMAAAATAMHMGMMLVHVPTILLSNTPDYHSIAKIPLPIDAFKAHIAALKDRLPHGPAAVIIGYLGDPACAPVIAAYCDWARSKGARIVVDPVFGDIGTGYYVSPESIAAIETQLLPLADTITPNAFEFAHLVKADAAHLTLSSAVTLAQQHLFNKYPNLRELAITSLITPSTPDDLYILGITPTEQNFAIAKPKLPVDFSGTGDVFTTALVINDLRMADFAKAMRKTACSMADICAIRDPDTPQLYPDATGRPSLPLPLAGTALTTPQSRLPLMYL